MVKRGVEISVVTNVCWQMHLAEACGTRQVSFKEESRIIGQSLDKSVVRVALASAQCSLERAISPLSVASRKTCCCVFRRGPEKRLDILERSKIWSPIATPILCSGWLAVEKTP